MPINVTMLQTRRGEDGTMWQSGRTYSASDAFATLLVNSNLASAVLPLPATAGEEQPVLRSLVNGAKNTVALLGDSRMAAAVYAVGAESRYDYHGWFIAMNQSLGAPFDVRLAPATTGVTSAVVRSTQLPLVLALNPLPAFVFIDCGYNDFVSGRTLADVITDVTFVVAQLYAAGIQSALVTSIPGSTISISSAAYVRQCAYNAWLVNQAAKLPGVCAVGDLASLALDPATGQIRSTWQDGSAIHVNAAGSAQLGVTIAPVFQKLARALSVPFVAANDATAQLMANPRLTGSTATGIGTGTTGTLPTNHSSGRSGTATAVFSQVARPDTLVGNRTKVAHTGGARGDTVFLAAANFNLRSYAPSSVYNLGDRIRPSTPNGYQYLVVAAGNSDATADPTDTWSTTLGTTFAVGIGSLQVKVVPSIDIGDKVQLIAEVWADSFTGGAVIYASLKVYTAGAATLLSTAHGGYCDNGNVAYPTPVAPYQVLKTPPITLPATAQLINVTVNCASEAAVTGNWYVGRIELQKWQ